MVRKNLMLDERLLAEVVRLSGERTYSGAVQRALGEFRRTRARQILRPRDPAFGRAAWGTCAATLLNIE